MSKLETTICGRRLDPFYGNAAADYTRVKWPNSCNEVTDYLLFSNLYKKGLQGFIETKTETIEKREGNPKPRHAWTRNMEQGIQSMELPCVGIYSYPYEKCDSPTIASFVGKNKEETKTMTLYLDERAKKKPNILDHIINKEIKLVINIPNLNSDKKSKKIFRDEYAIRTKAVEFGIPVVTNLELAKTLINSLVVI